MPEEHGRAEQCSCGVGNILASNLHAAKGCQCAVPNIVDAGSLRSAQQVGQAMNLCLSSFGPNSDSLLLSQSKSALLAAVGHQSAVD